MAFTYKLEFADGTPADPPTFRSSAGTSWNVGDVLYLGRRTLRVVEVRAGASEEAEPVLVVELAS
jgi:hypothetical protein